MRRNLDLEHCINEQEAVITAYLEELEENERMIAEGAWATTLDMSRIRYWYPLMMRYCRNHPPTRDLKWERENMKRHPKFADFFFWDCD